MGGSELNFLHADIQGKATIDITQTVGGLKLIVPSNWIIQSNITSTNEQDGESAKKYA